MKEFTTFEGEKVTLYEATAIARKDSGDAEKREAALLFMDTDGRPGVAFGRPMPEDEGELDDLIWNGDLEDLEEAVKEFCITCLESNPLACLIHIG